MKKVLFFCNLMFLACLDTTAQSPGGVSTDHLKLWLEANSIIAADGAVLGTWNDKSPKGFNATQTYTSAPDSAPNYEDDATYNINFNPSVLFNGTTSFMHMSGSNGSGDPAFVSSHKNKYSNYAVLQPDPSYAAGTASQPGKYFFSGTAGKDKFTAADVRNTGSILDSWNQDDNFSPGGSYQSYPVLITLTYDSATDTRTIYTYGKSISVNTSGTKNTTTGNTNYGLGCQLGASPHLEFYKGTMAELVSYTKTLQSASSAKEEIESYLAIKYGLTLSGENYLASNGTIVWNTTSGGSDYNKNIFGIARDDNNGLLQKESTSTGGTSTFTPGLLTIFIGGTKTTDNAGNSGSFTAGDKSFFMVGCDTTVSCGPQSSPKVAVPTGICCRLVEQWLTQVTNFTNTDVTLEFNLPACASTGLTAANLRLLVDNDGDFSNAVALNTIVGSGPALTSISVSGSVVDITLPASYFTSSAGYLDGKTHPYFTLGSVVNSTPLPVELLSFNAQMQKDNTVLATWSTASEVNNALFTVEKSQDGLDYETVGTLPGAGTSSQVHDYSMIDGEPYVGVSYYRLKQTDYDGSYSYSNVVPVTYYPNDPITIGNTVLNNSGSFVQIISKNQGASNIIIYDITGRKIYMKGQNLVAGVNKVDLNYAFTKGVYILYVESGSGNVAKKKVLAWQ